MKKFSILSVIVALAFFFSACSKESSKQIEEEVAIGVKSAVELSALESTIQYVESKIDCPASEIASGWFAEIARVLKLVDANDEAAVEDALTGIHDRIAWGDGLCALATAIEYAEAYNCDASDAANAIAANKLGELNALQYEVDNWIVYTAEVLFAKLDRINIYANIAYAQNLCGLAEAILYAENFVATHSDCQYSDAAAKWVQNKIGELNSLQRKALAYEVSPDDLAKQLGAINLYANTAYAEGLYVLKSEASGLDAAIALGKAFLAEDFSAYTTESVEAAKNSVQQKLNELNSNSLRICDIGYGIWSLETITSNVKAINIEATINRVRGLLELKPAAIVNFKGIEGVQVQYYVSGVWLPIEETLYNNFAEIYIPEGTTSFRVIKAGMYYQFDGLKAPYNDVYDAKVISLVVSGLNRAGQVAIVQGSWVYNWAPIVPGSVAVYNVFDNGRNFEVRWWPNGETVKSSGLVNINTLPLVPESGLPYVWFAP